MARSTRQAIFTIATTITLFAMAGVQPATAQTNPACGTTLTLRRGSGPNTYFNIGPQHFPSMNCSTPLISAFHILGSPSGLADTTLGTFPGLFIDFPGGTEHWVTAGASALLDNDTDYTSAQHLDCDEAEGEGDLPYHELTGGLYHPVIGGTSEFGQMGLWLWQGIASYGIVASMPFRSTDANGDGDTDEQDEAMLKSAMNTQDLGFDLNWSGVVDGTDLAIMMTEARRRTVSGERYLRGQCTGGSEPSPYSPANLSITAPSTPSFSTVAVVCGGNWKVQWIAGGDDGTTGTAYQYDLRTSTAPIDINNFASATPLTAPLPTASGTGQWILYPTGTTGRYFAIRAKDDSGEWSTGIATVFAPGLAEMVAPATTSGMTAIRTSGGGPGGQARIRWTSAGDDGSTGTPATYDLRYSEAPISAGNFNGAIGITPPAAAPAGTLMEVFFPMDACEQYYFALKTIDDQGNCSGVSNSPTATGQCQEGGLMAGDDTDRPQVPTRLSLAVHTVTSEAVEFELGIPTEFAGASQLVIHDVLGRRLATPLSASLSAGQRTVRWDLRAGDGRRVPIGVYAARWAIGGESRTVKFSVVR